MSSSRSACASSRLSSAHKRFRMMLPARHTCRLHRATMCRHDVAASSTTHLRSPVARWNSSGQATSLGSAPALANVRAALSRASHELCSHRADVPCPSPSLTPPRRSASSRTAASAAARNWLTSASTSAPPSARHSSCANCTATLRPRRAVATSYASEMAPPRSPSLTAVGRHSPPHVKGAVRTIRMTA